MSKALLMSMVAMIVLDGGLFPLNPSRMCWVTLVRRVVVEWFLLNPCWIPDVGRLGVIFVRMSFSIVLEIVHSREMGR